MQIDFEALWETAARSFVLGATSLHGPEHWRRVEQFGLTLSQHNGADIEIVRLFAVLHDSQRRSEGSDPQHGPRAAAYADLLQGEHFKLSGERLEVLKFALTCHADGMLSEDVTVGTCWDADRLDLGRVGVAPSATYLSMAAARHLLLSRKGLRFGGWQSTWSRTDR